MSYTNSYEIIERQNKISNYIVMGLLSGVLIATIGYDLLCNNENNSNDKNNKTRPSQLENAVKLVRE